MVELTEIARQRCGDGTAVLSKLQGIEDLLVLQVIGEFDAYFSRDARPFLEKNGFSYSVSACKETQPDPKRPSLIYDLESCRYLDSTGIGLMIGGLKATRVDGNFFGVVVGNPQIKKILGIAGVNKCIDLYKTLGQAVEAYQARMPVAQ